MNGLLIKHFVIAFIVLIILDMFWLGLIAKNLYLQSYEPWLRLSLGQLKPIWWAVLLVYLFLALGIAVFVLPLANHSLVASLIYGAIFGAIVYGVYDFTCLALFMNFPLLMGFFDWLWGIVLCGISAVVTGILAH